MYYTEVIARFKKYTTKDLRADIFSGLIVSLVSLPLAMSFSISVGLPPELGLYSAIIGGFIAAFFGGSQSNIVGPTGAFVAVLGAIMIQSGYQDLLVAGMIAGVILLLASIFRLGRFVQFVPYPVILGFTAGIGIIILINQITSISCIKYIKRHYFLKNSISITHELS